jgi:hypothetical protein
MDKYQEYHKAALADPTRHPSTCVVARQIEIFQKHGDVEKLLVLQVRGTGCFSTAYSSVHETPNLDWKAEFRFAESRFSQPLYQSINLLLFLQKQNLATAIYLFGLGTLLIILVQYQPLYLLVQYILLLLVQWLTESRFCKTKFGFPIEIRSLMSAGIGCTLIVSKK